jgi:hypothetical protein
MFFFRKFAVQAVEDRIQRPGKEGKLAASMISNTGTAYYLFGYRTRIFPSATHAVSSNFFET